MRKIRKAGVLLLLILVLSLVVSCGGKADEVKTDNTEKTMDEDKAGEKTDDRTAEETQSVDKAEEADVTQSVDNAEGAEETQNVDKADDDQSGDKDEDKSEAQTEEDEKDKKESEDDNMNPATLLYQGHASVRISTPEGKTIYVDPFFGDGYDVPADLILLTHGHYDHTKTDLISSKNAGCQTITWIEALSGGEHQTFDLGYVKVEAVEAGYNRNHDVSECVGYILTFSDGATLYLSGDTSTTPQMKELSDRKLDYAFFCCDGVYNMDMDEAIECAKTVGAVHSIPYHMVPSNNSNGFDQSVAESFDVPGRIIVKPGEELTLEK